MTFFKAVVVVCLIFFAVSCDRKREILSDNITAGLSIESVAKSENETISAGNDYFERGDFGTAIEYYLRAAQQNKATAFYNIGVCYYLLNNVRQAEANFRLAVEEDPSFDEAVMNLVAVLAQQEKIEEAEKYASRLIHTVKSPRVYVDMANISLKLGDTAKAAYYYKKALDEDSRSQFILSNYANFLISIGEYRDGADILERFDMKDFSVNYNLANAYKLMGDSGASYSYASEALYSPGATEEGCDKLARLFYEFKKYPDEAQALRMLVSLNPLKEYRSRLVTSYVNSNELDKALDEISFLLKDYPEDRDLNVLNYDVLIFANKIEEAGAFIRKAYSGLGGDKLLYYYAKHLSLYEKDQSPVKKLIFVRRDSDYLNLARTVYGLKNGDEKDARDYLSRVSEKTGHEYYYYKTYFLINDKMFREADAVSRKMDPYKPDTFWYRLIIAWNLRRPDALLETAGAFKDNPAVANIRIPSLRYRLIPVTGDMGFTYKFSGSGADAASMLAYPLFLEPDEVVQFLIMGRSTLKNSEKEKASRKLEGMKRNNEGVDAFYAYDFSGALKKFREASDLLAGNAEVSYNLGLTYFNLGDDEKASEYFEKSLVQDKDLWWSYLGLGLTGYRRGDAAAADNLFRQAMQTALADMDKYDKAPIDRVRGAYLALLGWNRAGKLAEAAVISETDDAFVAVCRSLMDYFENYSESSLASLEVSPVFRAASVGNLLKYGDGKASPVIETKDRYYAFARNFISLERGLGGASLDDGFSKDKVCIKDMVYASVFLNDRAGGLRYLQRLTNIDFTYPELYKASLYYFTWARDFVNAEASYGSLERLEYSDKTTYFYTMVYFLANYNETRLNQTLASYEERFKPDYRSKTVTALVNLSMKNISGFYGIMNGLLKEDPYLFDKMFIEVDLANF